MKRIPSKAALKAARILLTSDNFTQEFQRCPVTTSRYSADAVLAFCLDRFAADILEEAAYIASNCGDRSTVDATTADFIAAQIRAYAVVRRGGVFAPVG
jgi:hypothetical protein